MLTYIKRKAIGVLSSPPTCLTKRKSKAVVVELEPPENADGDTICTPLVFPNRRFLTGTSGSQEGAVEEPSNIETRKRRGSCASLPSQKWPAPAFFRGAKS
jgi:hypothetical protein